MLDKLEGHASQKGRQPSGVVNATNQVNQGCNLLGARQWSANVIDKGGSAVIIARQQLLFIFTWNFALSVRVG
jgi:hypothetical protein